jgi:iron complex outermembrane receptor protein
LGIGQVMVLIAAWQAFGATGSIRGVVKDPSQAAVSGARVVLTDQRTHSATTVLTDNQGVYVSASLPPGTYVIEVAATGFKTASSSSLELKAGQDITFNPLLQLAEIGQSVTVLADAENAYRVENVAVGGPLGTTPILDIPYSVNVISRQLIDDTQSRNVKQAAKYLPLASFQEMQGPEVIRPATRGMQGSNMQNARKDGMGIAVTTPSALEEYEQIEVVSGLGGQLYGPTNPSGVFNFATKRPTNEQFREVELAYEGSAVGTIHADFGGRFGANRRIGYRVNGVLADGEGSAAASQLRRQLIAGAADVRVTKRTLIEGNFSYYNLFQHGYVGWFAYAPTITPLSTAGSKSVLLPSAPDPAVRGFGQSFSGVDLKSKIGEIRLKHEFSTNWHLVAGGLNQVSDRNINTAVNQFVDNSGNFKTYLANSFSSLAPRFHVVSDSAYLDGRLDTGKIRHDVVVGTTGYRFATYSPVTGPAKTALCTSNTTSGICQANVSTPLVYVPPAAGVFSYKKTSPSTGIFGSSIIRQQGISASDSISLTPQWLVRLAGSEDWTWTDVYTATAASGFFRREAPGGYNNKSLSGSGSVVFKPRSNMSVYATLASSIQAPDVAAANSGSTITTNASQALPPYRSKEVEIGYKLATRRMNFSASMFRIKRPFANFVTGVSDPVCGAQSGTTNCQTFKISGEQLNYGAEGMVSGRIVESLMVTGGVSVLDPKLVNTGVAATDRKQFVGIPHYKSNVFAEYRLPRLKGVYLNLDWQHVGRRAMDDINSAYVPQYNLFDLGVRYTARFLGRSTTWRLTANNLTNVHYWSTLGPGSITGQSTGSYLGHLGEPRLFTASMRFNF